METIQVKRRRSSIGSSWETDNSVRTFIRAERPLGRRRSSSTSESDNFFNKNWQLINRQESVCQFSCERSCNSCKFRTVFSSPDRGERSTRSGRESSHQSLNTSTVSRRRDEDSSPELCKREWLPSSAIPGDSFSLGCTKTRRTRHDSSYSDVDIPVKKDVSANCRKEYLCPEPRFSVSDSRKRTLSKKKNKPTSTFKYDTKITSCKSRSYSSLGSEDTRSVQHANNQHATWSCNSSSPEISLSTSYRSHSSSWLSNNQILVQTKHRQAETRSPSSTESSCYYRFESNARFSRSIEKKRSSRSTEKKRSQRFSERNRSQRSSERNRSQRSSERKHSQRSSERKHSQRSSERKHSQRSSERKHSQRSSERKHSQRSSERKHSQRSSERKHSQRSSERKHSQRSSERKHSQRCSERKHSQRSSERKHSQRSSERKHSYRSSERKHSQRSSERNRSQRSSERNRSQRSSEKKHSQRSSGKKHYTRSPDNRGTHGFRIKANPSSSAESKRSLSRSDRCSPVSRKMSTSDRCSPDRFKKCNNNIVFKSKHRTQSPSLYETDDHRESGNFKRSSTYKRQNHYASPPDKKHSHRANRDRRSNEDKAFTKDVKRPREHGHYKHKDNKRDSDYMKVQIAVKRQRSSDSPSSNNYTNDCDGFENAIHLRKRRRLHDSDSCNQTDSDRIFMKTKVRSVALIPKTSRQDIYKDRHGSYPQADDDSSYHKQRSLRDDLLVRSCCQHSDEAWSNLKEQHDVDDSRGLSVAYGRKDTIGITSGHHYYSPPMATQQTPSGHHLKGSPSFSSPSFIANLSPRSTLKGLDQPHPWALDLLARSQTYRGTFVDSHCHIDLIYDRLGLSHETRFSDFRKMVANSFPGNFEGCVAVFCYPKTYDPINPQNQLFTTLAEEDGVWFAIGCHPKSATEFTARHEQGLRKALKQSNVVALGEIGLDYSGTFYRHAETQKMVLRKQLQMAMELNLPLVLHCRDAYDDCLAILKEMVPRDWPIHLHCFCGNPDTANVWLKTFPNLYIGLTPVITFRAAHDSINTARNIPLNRLLLETDSPYFVPGTIPKGRSSVSHPGFALFTAERIAELKNVSVDTVLQTCRTNTRNVYGI